MLPSGLAKLSANKALTSGCFTANLTASKSDTSTSSASQEKFLNVFVNCVIDPPYNFELAIILEPGSIIGNNAISCAACPDEVQQAPKALSKADILCSNADTVGLDKRE